MYSAKQKVLWFAIYSRISIFLLQLIFNAIYPDNNADAFRTPADPIEKYTSLDRVILLMFEGLTRWDAQYYIHIAKYGYTYENTLAFFPLLPIMIRYISSILKIKLTIISYSNIIVVSGSIINFIFFVKATLILYDLSEVIFKSTKVAYRAAILFCINPANIFFTAIYTETLFAYLTFYSMLESVNNNPCVFIPLSLSSFIRSNGLINIGFPIYFWLKNLSIGIIPKCTSEYTFYNSSKYLFFYLKFFFIKISHIIFIIILSFLPFCFVQMYNYKIFCKLEFDNTSLPLHILQHAQNNDLLLPGKREFSWCNFKLPIAYSHIQSKYWNVGFLTYYQFKQIPNFFLALPVLYLMLKCSIRFLIQYKSKFCTMEFFTNKVTKQEYNEKYPLEMFVFVVHGSFLTFFCIFFIHIQVSTRLLCSASPILYWYCALETLPKVSNNIKQNEYESQENILSKWKVFFLKQQQYSYAEKLIYSYFLGYSIVGCFMFSNFLPWT